jgi:cell division septum initiation protein DivIVA
MTDAPSFPVVLRGYDRFQVDETIQLVRDAVRSTDPVLRTRARDAAAARSFSIVLRGYDRRPVDSYLADAARRLAG